MTKLSNFKIIKLIGVGSFGKVVLAEHKKKKTTVVLKVIKKDYISSQGEFEAVFLERNILITVSQLSYPFAMKLFCTFHDTHRLFYVLEYESGGDLMEQITKKRFTYTQSKLYACEVLLALDFLHRHCIAYRDLKLDNIMLCDSGHIKLTDFGLSKVNMGYGDKTYTYCGTVDYMAPEIVNNKKGYTRAVDWWSYGVLLYEMFYYETPFRGKDDDETMKNISYKHVTFPFKINDDLESLILGLLDRNPKKRLGCNESDSQDIFKHPFFGKIDFAAVYRKEIQTQYVPSVDHPTDTSNFNSFYTKQKMIFTKKDGEGEKTKYDFSGFSYVCKEWKNDGYL